MPRSLSQIAEEIMGDMSDQAGSRSQATRRYGYVWLYIEAMRQMESIKQKYGSDDGEAVVLYFLSNAATWRGETARRIKAELKELVK